jgi:hypothetical protein
MSNSFFSTRAGAARGAVLVITLAFAASAAAAVAQTAPAEPDQWNTVVVVDAQPLTPANAPADEYFGRQKMSYLGVRNVIHAFAVEGGSPLALPLQRARIDAVHSALVDWGDKYPRDPWLPGSTLRFAYFLASKDDPFTDAMAADLLLQASQRFADTANGKRALKQLRSVHQASTVDYAVDTTQPPDFFTLALRPI